MVGRSLRHQASGRAGSSTMQTAAEAVQRGVGATDLKGTQKPPFSATQGLVSTVTDRVERGELSPE